jgi:hypothetical protein
MTARASPEPNEAGACPGGQRSMCRRRPVGLRAGIPSAGLACMTMHDHLLPATYGSAASRAFERARGPGRSSRAGIPRSDEHGTFPPLPRDRHPSAGHPLPDRRPYPRLPARQHQPGLDRALPPGPSRSAGHPRPVTELRPSPAANTATDIRPIRLGWLRALAPGAGDNGAESAPTQPARGPAVRRGRRPGADQASAARIAARRGYRAPGGAECAVG